MRTRSGQSYEPLSCYKCKKYYAYTKFNNLCSKCCLEKFPNKVNITRKNHLSISKEEENKLIENNTIPESNPLYKYLIKNYKANDIFPKKAWIYIKDKGVKISSSNIKNRLYKLKTD